MECVAGIAILAVILGGIFGLGWIVIQPLGYINRARVKAVRFQLLDVFWLVLLLQPSLVLFANLVAYDRRYFQSPMLGIFVLVWVCTLVGWYAMTGALSKAGVTRSAKRAAAVLVILPMIGVVNPLALLLHFMLVAYVANDYLSLPVLLGALMGEIAYIAALYGCRRLSRWIAVDVPKAASDS